MYYRSTGTTLIEVLYRKSFRKYRHTVTLVCQITPKSPTGRCRNPPTRPHGRDMIQCSRFTHLNPCACNTAPLHSSYCIALPYPHVRLGHPHGGQQGQGRAEAGYFHNIPETLGHMHGVGRS